LWIKVSSEDVLFDLTCALNVLDLTYCFVEVLGQTCPLGFEQYAVIFSFAVVFVDEMSHAILTYNLHIKHNTFRPFGRRFYPKRLTKSTFVEGDSNI